MKKKSILITLIITILMNSMIAIPINSIAAVEDGDFVREELPYDIVFKEISVGENHTLAIDSDGNLWAWGYNDRGQLGTENTNFSVCPIQIKKGTKFSKVAAGQWYSLAIDEDGNLWSWGYQGGGRLGDGESGVMATSRYTPEIVGKGKIFKEICAGSTRK